MRKFSSIIIFVLLFALQNCQSSSSSQSNQKYLQQFKNNQKPLKVLSVSPTGELDHAPNQVIVHYSQPMVSLQSLHQSQNSSPFVEITPQPQGSFRWVNSRTLVFETKGEFDYATKYQVKVLAGEQSQLGYALLNEEVYTFETPRPQVVGFSPTQNGVISFEPKIQVLMNQNVSVQEMFDHLEVKVAGQKVDARVVCAGTAQQNASVSECKNFSVIPKQKLAPNVDVTVTITKGLKSLSQGQLSMPDTAEVNYRTYGDLKLTDVSCYGECGPESSVHLELSHPIVYKDVIKHVSFEPSAKINEEQSYYSKYNKTLYVVAEFKPQTEYKVILKKGLKDALGQSLKEDLVGQFKMGHRSSFIRFLGRENESVEPKDPEVEFGFEYQNIKEVKYFVQSQVSEEQWISVNKNLYEDKKSCTNLISSTKPHQVYTSGIDDERKVVSVPFKKLFQSQSPHFVLLCLEYKSDDKIRTVVKAMQLTDLGIQPRLGRSGGQIFISKITNNKIVSDAKVKAYTYEGDPLWNGVTNSKGLVDFPGLKNLEDKIKGRLTQKEIEDYKFYPLQIFAQTSKEQGFVSSDWELDYTWGVFPHRLNSKYFYETQNERVHILTDRGLYKPGETVHFKGFARIFDNGGFKPFEGSLEINLSGPRNIKFEPIVVETNDRGNFTFEFETKEFFQTGRYHAVVRQPDDKDQKTLASLEFQVEEFRKPEFEVKISDKGLANLIKGQALDLQFSSQYLFGQPLKKAAYQLGATKSIGHFSAKGFEDWYTGRLWGQFREDDDKLRQALEEKKGQLNAKGLAEVTFKTDSKWIDPVSYSIWVNVKDVAGVSIGQRRSVTVHPAKGYVAAKVKDLFHNQKNPIEYEYKTLDLKGEEASVLDVKEVKLFQEEWVSVKKETIQGQFETSYERQNKLIDSCDQNQVQNKTCQPRPKKSGYHFLEFQAKDKDENLTVTQVPVYVYGGDFYPWMAEDSHRLDLELKNKNLKIGDTAEIFVKSPFRSGKLLVSIERDKVLSTQVFDFKEGLKPLQIPIQKDLVPNAFVRVVLLKGYDDVDPTQVLADGPIESFSLIKSGTIELKVEPENKTLVVNATPKQATYQAGDLVQLDFNVENLGQNEEAELTVMVVDEGVLQAAGFHLSNPLQTLYRPFGHKVSLSDSRKFFNPVKLAQLFKDKKLESPASGGGQGNHQRKSFVPLAYFNPSVETEQGQAQVTFTLPDQMTKYRVMVVANSEVDRFGLAQTDFISNKDLFLTTSFPQVMRWSDVVQTDLVAHNTSDKPQEVRVKFNINDLQVSFDQKIKLEAGESKAVPVTIRLDSEELLNKLVTDLDHQLSLIARASLESQGQVVDQLEDSLTVQRKGIEQRFVMNDVLQDEAYEVVQKSKLDDPNLGSFRLSLESHLMGQIQFLVNDLFAYPYSCLEQRISKAYPLVLFYKNSDYFEGDLKKQSERQKYLQELIQYIKGQQSYNGSFGFWNRRNESAFVTLSMAPFVAELQVLGFDVGSIKNKLTKRLKEYVQNKTLMQRLSKGIGEDRLLAEALYGLYRLGEPLTNYDSNVVEVFESLPVDIQAMMIEMFHSRHVQKDLIQTWKKSIQNHVTIKGKTVYLKYNKNQLPYYYSGKEVEARVVRTLLQVDPAHPFLFRLLRSLVHEKGLQAYRSSFMLRNLLQALAEYQKVFPSQNESFEVNVSLNKEDLFETKLSPKRNKDQVTIPLSKLPNKMEFFLTKEGAQPVFYEMQLKTVAKEYRDYALEQGVFISRRFFDAEDNEVQAQDLKEGTYYFVVLDVYFSHAMKSVVIDEPIASLFDPVHSRIKTSANIKRRNSSFNSRIQHMDIKKDRIYFYFDRIASGYYQLSYPVMTIQSGQALIPPALAQDMYDQDVFGSTAKQRVMVK